MCETVRMKGWQLTIATARTGLKTFENQDESRIVSHHVATYGYLAKRLVCSLLRIL